MIHSSGKQSYVRNPNRTTCCPYKNAKTQRAEHNIVVVADLLCLSLTYTFELAFSGCSV